jgi:LPPG:FO 2-phospho-L-lactate transferase
MDLKVVTFTGGVGGAKLADGLAQVLPPESLSVVVNTGDDFKHFGLKISPDLDTVLYTLAGISNPDTGWGRIDETWQFMETIKQLGGPTWFNLGDRDLAIHAERTRRLESGESLSAITADMCAALGVRVQVLPMTDYPVHTIVETQDGELEFQRYFVEFKAEPVVQRFRFDGSEKAEPAPGVIEVIKSANLVIFCPSNPWVSLDPILSIAGIQQALQEKAILGVSPIIGGKAIKGPAATMFEQLGIQPSAAAVAEHFQNQLRYFVIDRLDEDLQETIEDMGIEVLVTNTLMLNRHDRQRLAREIVDFVNNSTLKEGAT